MTSKSKLHDETGWYDEDTLFKFAAALGRAGVGTEQIMDITNEVLSADLLIRERAPQGKESDR